MASQLRFVYISSTYFRGGEQMWKVLLAGIAVLTVGGATQALAQQTPAPAPAQQTSAASAPRWTAEDAAAFSEARIAALKVGLTLKPDQEKNWKPFETAMRDMAKQSADRASQRMAERKDPAKTPDPVDQLRQRGEAMTTAGAGLKRLADAVEPLYKSLDDSQKRRMVALMSASGRRR
jgi:zinc resistance-associated protein